mgnify:CR=1 FL=1
MSSELFIAEAVPPPRRKWNWVLIILLGASLFVPLSCCGVCGGGMYWAMQVEADKVADVVRDHPLVHEKLGGITSCSCNMWDDLTHGNSDQHVFQVRGPNGHGQLISEEFLYRYISIKLKTDEGEWELLPQESDK